MAPSVSILPVTEFDCSLLFICKSSTQVVYVNSKHPLSQFQISVTLCHAIPPLDLIKVENSMSPSPIPNILWHTLPWALCGSPRHVTCIKHVITGPEGHSSNLICFLRDTILNGGRAAERLERWTCNPEAWIQVPPWPLFLFFIVPSSNPQPCL